MSQRHLLRPSVSSDTYASHFRTRPAYRFTLEDRIHLDSEARGRDIGRLLPAELIARCEAIGARQMLAEIGNADGNAASIGLHRGLGFEDAGVLASVARKVGAWWEMKLMQCALGPGANHAPST